MPIGLRFPLTATCGSTRVQKRPSPIRTPHRGNLVGLKRHEDRVPVMLQFPLILFHSVRAEGLEDLEVRRRHRRGGILAFHFGQAQDQPAAVLRLFHGKQHDVRCV